eukprot:6203621-Pleurochrysis_carterae.AAC.2
MVRARWRLRRRCTGKYKYGERTWREAYHVFHRMHRLPSLPGVSGKEVRCLSVPWRFALRPSPSLPPSPSTCFISFVPSFLLQLLMQPSFRLSISRSPSFSMSQHFTSSSLVLFAGFSTFARSRNLAFSVPLPFSFFLPPSPPRLTLNTLLISPLYPSRPCRLPTHLPVRPCILLFCRAPSIPPCERFTFPDPPFLTVLRSFLLFCSLN